MARVIVFLADGFEEIEAVTIIDVLRRAAVEVTTVALSGRSVVGAHQIEMVADASLEEVDVSSCDGLILPGGMPGSSNLRDDRRVLDHIVAAVASQKVVAAICAAPIALEAAGVLRGKRATSYPGFSLPSANYQESRVVEDGNLITSRGPGTALSFAFALVSRFADPGIAEQLRAGMLVEG